MPEKYYYVTFDIVNSAGKTGDYAKVRERLKFRFHADNYWDPLKQGCII